MDQKALAFAEDAIAAIGERDAPRARTCVAQACEVDHSMDRLADAVYLACSELETKGEVSTATWNTLGDAVGSGELLDVVEAHRTS
jgi:hypothetical protein